MIVCPRCAKENQDHYKFCLGCGAELPRDAAQPKSFTAPTPPAGFPAKSEGDAAGAAAAPAPAGGGAQFGGAAAAPAGGGVAAAPAAPPAPAPQPTPGQGAAPAPAAGGDKVDCPQCGQSNPRNFKFCGSCGFNLQDYLAKQEGGDGAGAAPAAAPAPAPAAAPSGAQKGSLVLIKPDGTEGDSFPLGEGETVIGRESGGVFASDSYLSPKHATFAFSGGALTVRDEDSLNGVYLRVDPDVPHELTDGRIFRIGQEIILFSTIPEPKKDADGVEHLGSPNPGYLGRIALVIGRESYGNAYCIPPEGLHLGRERGDIIFPDDGYVSGLHCRIHGEGGKVMLTDVGSSNGTFIRVAGSEPLKSGVLLLMGQQLFRVEF